MCVVYFLFDDHEPPVYSVIIESNIRRIVTTKKKQDKATNKIIFINFNFRGYRSTYNEKLLLLLVRIRTETGKITFTHLPNNFVYYENFRKYLSPLR